VSAVVFLDIVGVITFAGAFIAVLTSRPRPQGIAPELKYLMLVGIGLYLFVCVSNVLEHADVTAVLDPYEDYAEVLFVPLVAYVVYSRSTSEQLLVAEAAELRARHEHSLLMRVVETTPAGILVADDSGQVSLANDEARRIVEMLSPAAGRADAGAAPVNLAVIVRSAPFPTTLDAVDHDGEVRWLSVRATPLPTEATDATRAVVVLEDVTDRVLTERELEGYRHDLERLVDRRTAELLEVNRELEDANEARQRFLANMSHELRTPLNSIIGFTDLLLRQLAGPLTEEQRTQLGMVKESSTQLLGLVDDVLDLARVEAGHGVVTLTQVELGARVDEIVASMAVLAEVRGVQLSCDCANGPLVRTDTDKLGQIVRNLVSNAIKFTDPGGAVEVQVTERGDEVLVAVTDTGIGIAEADQARIFEAFQQVETVDRAKPQGTGLGLAICRELCDLLGYRLTLRSAPGVGSTFTLVIPRDGR
jgi:signal transduction histidine kinase